MVAHTAATVPVIALPSSVVLSLMYSVVARTLIMHHTSDIMATLCLDVVSILLRRRFDTYIYSRSYFVIYYT